MIEELIEILRRSGFDVCAEDIADILWLATHTEQGIAYRVQSSVEEIQAQETPSLAQKSMAKRLRRGKERQEPEDPPIESLADNGEVRRRATHRAENGNSRVSER